VNRTSNIDSIANPPPKIIKSVLNSAEGPAMKECHKRNKKHLF
jgi:hypothetical protein